MRVLGFVAFAVVALAFADVTQGTFVSLRVGCHYLTNGEFDGFKSRDSLVKIQDAIAKHYMARFKALLAQWEFTGEAIPIQEGTDILITSKGTTGASHEVTLRIFSHGDQYGDFYGQKLWGDDRIISQSVEKNPIRCASRATEWKKWAAS